MADDDLDRILSGGPDIAPSSGFVRNVMTAVQREASIPEPIPFPWHSAAPGLAIGTSALVAILVIATMRFGGSGALASGPMPHTFLVIVEEINRLGLGWIALALVASFVPMRLVVARR